MAGSTAGIVQFLFDLQVDAKSSRATIKNFASSLKEQGVAMEEAKTKTNKLSGAFKSMGAGAKEVVGQLGGLGSVLGKAGIAGFLLACIAAAYDFQKVLMKTAQTADVSGGNFGKMAGAIQGTSAALGMSWENAAELVNEMGKYGPMSDMTTAKLTQTTIALGQLECLHPQS